MDFVLNPAKTGGTGAPAAGDPVKSSNAEAFMVDVIQASQEVPVIVDFWAPWCGPCKTLTPIIEKLVRAARGKVRLVKLNIEESEANKMLAAQMRIQSIPAVYAFFQGRPVDGFVGALPESQIKQFIDRLIAAAGGGGVEGDPIAQALEHANALLEGGDLGAAADIFNQILAHDPHSAGAIAGLIRVRLATGDIAGARAILNGVPADLARDQGISAARTALELAEQGQQLGETEELAVKVSLNPDDHQARYDLALALFAHGRREKAVDELLEIVRRDREWNEQAARKQLLKLFEAMGPSDPLTVTARKRLSSILFA